MLNTSLKMTDWGARVEQAIDRVLENGARTRDLGGSLSTKEMGDLVCQALR